MPIKITRETADMMVHSAYYRVVRRARPVLPPQFFGSTVVALIPVGDSPSGLDDFWWESIAIEIQNAFLNRGWYIQNFTGEFLFQSQSNTWASVVEHIGNNMIAKF